MEPHVDARLQDGEALEEIELYADVLIAAAGSERPLSTDELDRVLGVRPRAQHHRNERGGGAPGRSRPVAPPPLERP
ncbi:hypothetical protein O4J56_26600 [Nocardiopsis sp. RSe5-2]|uniref:Uncharacterized protein n=1 Tax=Nocardiopsis endophytica TaxID=3018445 RepID=A0ABT4UB93_9ACTN|nr:hypothetical protein [Nocardiopsis endophytica]MDA2814247.1 hypothetical protein [Nocardiopsis endophytica]